MLKIKKTAQRSRLISNLITKNASFYQHKLIDYESLNKRAFAF